MAETIELDLAWEFAPEDDFGFCRPRPRLFLGNATLAQQAGALFRLYEAPHYFRRAGKAASKKAPAEILQQALAAIEKKKAMLAQIDEWLPPLGRGECPAAHPRPALQNPVQARTRTRPEYKAVVEASRATPPRRSICCKGGRHRLGLPVPWKRFCSRTSPRARAFRRWQRRIADDLPLAPVQAYSIDDSQTTEIDDALSVQGLGTGTVVLGIPSQRLAWPSSRQRH